MITNFNGYCQLLRLVREFVVEKQIFISARDRHYILDCLAALSDFPGARDAVYVRQLEHDVKRAQVILDPIEMPSNVITMHSRVRLKNMESQVVQEFTLVYPSERDPENGRISVLSPMGATMIGYSVGETFEVSVHNGQTRFMVEAITYQPESAGDECT